MSFFEHLTDLRKRLINSLIAVGICMCVGLYFSQPAFSYLARPMLKALRDAHLADKLIYTSPTGYISLLISVGLYLGLVMASPVVFHQMWMFIAPGLYRNERRGVVSFVFSSVFLFLAGMAFGYYVMMPLSLKFLLSFPGPVTPLIRIDDYFDLVLIILLGLGVVFEIPILIFFLSLFGIVTPKFLWKNIRYAMLLIAILAAIVTPTTDATTMMIFMAPMVLLYFLGILVSYFVVRRRRLRTVAGEGAP